MEEVVKASFPDDPVMVKIAKCESHFTQYDASSSDGVLHGKLHYPDVGVFQINTKYHPYEESLTLEGNIAIAKELRKANGYKDWDASKSCWQ